MCLFSDATLIFGEIWFCVLVLALRGQARRQSHSWWQEKQKRRSTVLANSEKADSAFYSFIFHVLSVNTSFIVRRRERKCLFRKNIKKSAAGGKQSEEREEETLRGYESDRGWKTKECQEGWGRSPVWRFLSFAVLHVHLQPLMGRSEIREKENRRFIRLQMRSLLCTTEDRNKQQRHASFLGLPPLLRLHHLHHLINAGYWCSKAP